MFLGAEGTLGIVTEATVKLAPLLPTKVAVVNFPSVEDAVRAATEVYVTHRSLLMTAQTQATQSSVSSTWTLVQ